MNKHPAIATFFLTEMWERYGFYVVQSLLAIFLVSQYGLLDEQTYRLVSSFTALTYVSPVIGGLIADKWLGQVLTVRIGAIVLSLSYLLMSLDLNFFALTFALSGVAVGTGLLKPNISSLLGNQYKENCPDRERGFILFYMGITTGIILGTTLPTAIYKHLGWNMCFLSACIGLLIAFVKFSIGVKRFEIKDYIHLGDSKVYGLFKAIMVICVFWNVFFITLSRPKIALWFFSLVLVFAAVYVSQIYLKEKGGFRKELTSLLLLCLISVFFWAFYFQMFLSLTLFITRSVKPTLWGFNFPAPYYVAVESFALLVFGFLFARYAPKTKRISIAESTAWKFTTSMVLMLGAYALICLSMEVTKLHQLVPPVFLLCAYVVIALSEILLSPVGLSAVTEISKPKYVSTLTGVFFISLGLGGFLSGVLANITSLNAAQPYMLANLQINYQQAFLKMLSLLSVAVAISFLIALLIRYLHRTPNEN